ncbi:restriction endonuclease subunit S [Acinetobacter sp.]|uniref:restriction endonuclease subunit S n=1 Tax=Acinetobacter sp. TaxID=472 RepID=UPI003CFC8FD6
MSGVAEVSLSSDTYNQTEIGKFPIDWEVVSLQDAATFGGGTTPPRKLYDKYYVSGVHPWVKTLDLNNGVIAVTEENVTDAALAETSLKKHPAGSVLIAMYGGFNQIGRTGLIAIDAAINQALVAVIPRKGKLVSEYLLYNFNYKVEYWKGVASSSRKDPNITSNDVKNYLLPLPTVKEQTAIANALSDVDALISELEKLIAKKQAIKTATMQQLLTGRTRLPQFALREDGTPKGTKPSELGEIPEDWEVLPLGTLASIKTGSKNNQDKVTDGQFPFFVRSQNIERLNSYSYDCEAILVPGEGGIGSIFHYINGKFDAHQRVYVIRDFKKCVGKYIYFQMKRSFGSHAVENSVKATVDSLRLPTFLEFKVLLPSEEEQTAIAAILSDMDAEIQALEQRLGKTRQIKQGMMQELLTGKTRLIQGSEIR